ncbi:hypothetical protein ACROYT_G026602 [Oculina patagonica]
MEVQAAEDILTSPEGGFRYKYLGCYRDRSSPRALPERLYNAKQYVNWKVEGYNLKKVIDVCAAHARNRSGVSLFGVQFYKECWGGGKGSQYDIYKESSNCFLGVGGAWTNAVYELISDCEVNGFTYKDGEPFYIPQNPIQNDVNITCQSCSCNQGATSCPSTIKCDLFSKVSCERINPAPQGKCCPTCACYHKNTQYKDGQTWVARPNIGECFECTCVKNEPKCEQVHCQADCPNPVYEPGKCCPLCNPGAPVTEASFTIPEATTRPAPKFPPFPGFPGNQKRGLKMKHRGKRSN